MGRKSVAEYSKTYRDKKKASENGDEWKKEQSLLVLKYYIPVCDMTPAELKRVREKRKRQKAEYRRKLKEKKQQNFDDYSPPRSTRSERQPLIVKFDFKRFCKDKKANTRRRISRAVAKANREKEKLRKQNKTLKRNNWRLSKQLQRLREKTEMEKNAGKPKKNDPKVRATNDILAAKLDPKKHPQLLKKMTAHYALLLQMKKRNEKKLKKSKRSIESILSGNITRKYRMITYLGNETCTNRNHLKKTQMPWKRKSRLFHMRDERTKRIVKFFERDDVSQINPGKRDSKKICKNKVQTRILTDYLKNLWKRYTTETGERVSLALFCRYRPKHIKLTKLTNRQTCLCRRHQNLALKLQAINNSWRSPDFIVGQKTDEEIIAEVQDKKNIKFSTWKKDEIEQVTQWRCVNKTQSHDGFVDQLQKDLDEFRTHVRIISEQFNALSVLKDSLKANEVLVQMDFSENFKCRSKNEVQENYWHVRQATVHPVVIYYRGYNGILTHKNYVYLSPVQAHTPSAIFCILEKINKSLSADVQKVYYWTDSPSSQYRNRTMAHVTGNHRYVPFVVTLGF